MGVLTLFYMLMPVGRLPLRHALVGGIAAALLWEGVRYGLLWYFTNLSLVNVVYGSLTLDHPPLQKVTQKITLYSIR